MSDPLQQSGLFASLRRLSATALEMVQVRLELLGTEFELEKRRLFDGLVWAVAAVLLLGIGLVLLCGFVILLFWEGYRLAAVGVMAFLFLAGSAALLLKARQLLRTHGGLFATSAAELQRDRSQLQSPDQNG